jgi:hypothetical protein
MRQHFSEEKSRFLTPKNGFRNDKRLSYRNVRNVSSANGAGCQCLVKSLNSWKFSSNFNNRIYDVALYAHRFADGWSNAPLTDTMTV